MRFAISGLMSPDASARIDLIANPFAAALGSELATVELSCAAEVLIFAPIIIPASLGTVQNESKYRRRQRAIVISRNIDHAWWMLAQQKDRLTQYAQTLSDGLNDIDRGALSPTDVQTCRACIARATSEVAGIVE